MNTAAPIYIAGHRGLVGSALARALTARGHANLITRTRGELDLPGAKLPGSVERLGFFR